MKKILVLGGGMVGSAIASDLCNEFDVTVADINTKRLKYLKSLYPFKTVVNDLSKDGKISELVKDYRLVISAVPGKIGFETLQAIISAGVDVVDISFFERDPFELTELAKDMSVTAILDCGIAPGLSNIILGYHNELMEVESYECYVGGLPYKRKWPFEYKAFFSPGDVIQEYIRPARYVSNGKIVTVEALSDPELIEFDEVGTLEAFNTDGLRTLIKTMEIPNMIEKTMRYPGHKELMKVFRDSGFFSDEEIMINEHAIRPVDLTSKLLFKHWKPQKDEDEFTIMKLVIKGKEADKTKEYVYEIFDRFDRETGISSMARTTGYTCTAVARLLLEGNLKNKGISPPEYIGAIPSYNDRILNMLRQKNINIRVTENQVS
ncbi:MAG: saccharopine dehydrogenase C-terminal domain-containing protein [Ignavibacteriaceae bacterium]